MSIWYCPQCKTLNSNGDYHCPTCRTPMSYATIASDAKRADSGDVSSGAHADKPLEDKDCG